MRYFRAGEEIEFVLSEKQELTFEKHNHVSKYVAGLILEGEAELAERDRISTCVSDDLFIIPVFRVHALSLKSEQSRVLTMCVDVSFLENHSVEEGRNSLCKITEELKHTEIIDEKQEEAFLDALEIIYKMLMEQEQLPDALHDITQLVIREPERDWKLDELAEQIYINKYYLIRKFKEKIGLTPHYFQIQNRIRKSQYLLRQGESIADTAVEMGFYDQSHFDKSFRSITGISPIEYVNSIAAEVQKQ